MKKLTKRQRKVLERLVRSGIIEEGFYLAGGTALTLKYNHRGSRDFDFFSESFFKNSPLHYLNILQRGGDLKIEMLKADTLIFFLQDVRCSFFLYPYKLIRPLEKIKISISDEEKNNEYVAVASDEDIAGMKAVAIVQRGTKKDFYDLWFLMKTYNWNLTDVKKICKTKYGALFPESAFERAIVYFDDAEKESFSEIDPFWEEIKQFFVNVVKHPVSSKLKIKKELLN
ncbi:nucleotidyl transferase AbiEii/AbiGii toxin family protein [Thermodesulfobacterium sp. TA1]|uniref:nucleotidyl transferase AbiEii/AbiGii toxin family protein n=1 Tax=Thermodesulfobacterium sp. TA1 TaxID=2234087 RepID=UPI001231A788|nr:nucleotidyl transferase AbiEii/AbiGii toxin family protein [Thermodesulfobacterium sp. TA1]QER41880.1 nucleotidyl transferase AbiEii/AbiGii toxin family protein [Thermodesulfobacterium sp. TA1]